MYLIRGQMVETCVSLVVLSAHLFLMVWVHSHIRSGLRTWLVLPIVLSLLRLPILFHLHVDCMHILQREHDSPGQTGAEATWCVRSFVGWLCPGASFACSLWYFVGAAWSIFRLIQDVPPLSSADAAFIATFAMLTVSSLSLAMYGFVVISSAQANTMGNGAGVGIAMTSPAAIDAVDLHSTRRPGVPPRVPEAMIPMPITLGREHAGAAVRRAHVGPPNRYTPSRASGGLDNLTISLMPTFTFGTNEGKKEVAFDPTCTICLVDFEIGEELKELPCQHVFHTSCIDLWLRRHRSCPLRCPDMSRIGYRRPFVNSPVNGLGPAVLGGAIGGRADADPSRNARVPWDVVLTMGWSRWEAMPPQWPHDTNAERPLSLELLSTWRMMHVDGLRLEGGSWSNETDSSSSGGSMTSQESVGDTDANSSESSNLQNPSAPGEPTTVITVLAPLASLSRPTPLRATTAAASPRPGVMSL